MIRKKHKVMDLLQCSLFFLALKLTKYKDDISQKRTSSLVFVHTQNKHKKREREARVTQYTNSQKKKCRAFIFLFPFQGMRDEGLETGATYSSVQVFFFF